MKLSTLFKKIFITLGLLFVIGWTFYAINSYSKKDSDAIKKYGIKEKEFKNTCNKVGEYKEKSCYIYNKKTDYVKKFIMNFTNYNTIKEMVFLKEKFNYQKKTPFVYANIGSKWMYLNFPPVFLWFLTLISLWILLLACIIVIFLSFEYLFDNKGFGNILFALFIFVLLFTGVLNSIWTVKEKLTNYYKYERNPITSTWINTKNFEGECNKIDGKVNNGYCYVFTKKMNRPIKYTYYALKDEILKRNLENKQ